MTEHEHEWLTMPVHQLAPEGGTFEIPGGIEIFEGFQLEWCPRCREIRNRLRPTTPGEEK